MTESLYDLTRKKKNKSPTEWTDKHDKAFENVKDILINAPVLAFPRPDDTFILDTDASNSESRCNRRPKSEDSLQHPPEDCRQTLH